MREVMKAHNPNDAPAVVTVVANTSRSTVYAQERASNREPPLRTGAVLTPTPQPIRRAPDLPPPSLTGVATPPPSSPRHVPVPRNFAERVAAGAQAADNGPREGIGRGEVPPGGTKMR